MKSVRIAPLTLSRSKVLDPARPALPDAAGAFLGCLSLCVQRTYATLFGTLEAQERPANHQQGRNGRYKGANQQRQRNEDHLVNKGPFRYAPHHRQLTVRPHAADLLRVQRQIISQYPGGFRRQFSITEMSSSKVAISSSNVNKLLPAKISILLFAN